MLSGWSSSCSKLLQDALGFVAFFEHELLPTSRVLDETQRTVAPSQAGRGRRGAVRRVVAQQRAGPFDFVFEASDRVPANFLGRRRSRHWQRRGVISKSIFYFYRNRSTVVNYLWRRQKENRLLNENGVLELVRAQTRKKLSRKCERTQLCE